MHPRRAKKWAAALRRSDPDLAPESLAALVADRVAAALGLTPVASSAVHPGTEGAIDGPTSGELAGAAWPDPPDGWADPWLVGLVHEQTTSAGDRRARGAWYTPRPVVEGLVRLATADDRVPNRLVDPTCGGGAFLLAGLDRLVELGLEPAEAVERIAGIDIDPLAVDVSRWSVQLWFGARLLAAGVDVDEVAIRLDDTRIDLRRADSLHGWPSDWHRPLVVAGNPPFASPLKRGAVPDSAAERRAAAADLLGPYADIAAVHLLDTVERAGPGSTVVLVQPQSILASRDTEALRSHLDERAPLRALWAAREPVFDAGVRACAPVLAVGDSERPGGAVTVAHGPDVTVRGARPLQRWGSLAADALGAPSIPPLTGCLGELATATAGFRDEHYGLVSVCREASDGETADGVETARLVTVGSVDPLDLAWGRRPMRFGGTDWDRPIVSRSGLSPRVGRWFDAQLKPKVLLATQTKLLEPIVDRRGDLMPATPLIAIHAEVTDLDHITAVLLAPPVVLWAWRRWFGTALTVDAVKLAARQVGELPLPADRSAWDEAAALVAASAPSDERATAVSGESITRIGAIMTAAYGASSEVYQWWADRLAPSRMESPTTKGG